MRASLYLFLVFFLLFCTNCSKDEAGITSQPDDSDTSITEDFSSYVPINWEKTIINKMDLSSGEVSITCSSDQVPSFKDGLSLIVLETDSVTYLRRVMAAKTTGNIITLQTIKADMTELFANTEFTLSLTPSTERTPTKAGIASITNDGILHPIRIVEFNKNGSYKTIYDIKNDITKGDLDTKLSLVFDVDHSGKVITASKDGNLSLYWDTYKQILSLNATAHFKFSEAKKEKQLTEKLKIKVSELEEASFTIGASAQWDMILGANAKGAFKVSEEDGKVILIKNMLPYKIFYFLTPAGIPIAVTLKSDLMGEFQMNGEAQLTIKGGVSFKGSLTTGIKYTKDSNWKPIGEAAFEYEVHPIEIEGKAEIDMSASAYPRLELKLYDFLGPIFSPKPFLKDEAKVGFFNIVGSTGKDYYGGTQKAYAGIDLETSIMLNFIGLQQEVSLPSISYQREILNVPDSIGLKFPKNGSPVEIGKPTVVTFSVTGKILKPAQPLSNIVVKFESVNGEVNQNFGVSDSNGEVAVQWTPSNPESSVTAKIFDADGKVISEATFKPKQEFSMVGKWWEKSYHRFPQYPYTDLSVPTDSYLDFQSDGTFEYILNPRKEQIWIGEWNDGTESGYMLGPLYRIIRGDYNVVDSELKTNATYYDEEWEHERYDFFGNYLGNGYMPPEDGVGKDYFGGKVVFINNNEMRIRDSYYIRITDDFNLDDYNHITKSIFFQPQLKIRHLDNSLSTKFIIYR